MAHTDERIESIRYSAYGVPFGIPGPDVNGDGIATTGDLSVILGSFGKSVGDPGYSINADVDQNGTIDSYDSSTVTSWLGGTMGQGKVSNEITKNRKGFGGYEHDAKLETIAHVRNRIYQTELGRWNTRDPLGFVDGPNVYGYVKGNPVSLVDEDGQRAIGCAGGGCGGAQPHPVNPGPIDSSPVQSIDPPLVTCAINPDTKAANCASGPSTPCSGPCNQDTVTSCTSTPWTFSSYNCNNNTWIATCKLALNGGNPPATSSCSGAGWTPGTVYTGGCRQPCTCSPTPGTQPTIVTFDGNGSVCTTVNDFWGKPACSCCYTSKFTVTSSRVPGTCQ